MQNSKNHLLLIFIKNPEPGKVKTRLAAGVGNEKALSIYKKLLHHTRGIVQALQVKKQLWYSRFVDEEDDWPEDAFQKQVQKGEDLGERMKFAFKKGFENRFKEIVIIGGDCAELKAADIEKGFKALEDNDAVIGPAKDGGYYLLGLKQFIPELFENKPWGTRKVLEQTIDDCEKYNIQFKLLEKLIDIDTEEDWEELKELF